MCQTLIVGLDEAAQGRDALALGRLLAERLGAEPVVARDLASLFQDLDPEERVAACRAPGEFLSRVSGAEDAAMAVIGSPWQRPFGRLRRSGAGRDLLHGAGCAVAVAPCGYAEREYTCVRRLGVAFDGSDEGWVALETAIRLAERLHAKLHVITVIEPTSVGYGGAYSGVSSAVCHSANQKQHARVLETGIDAVPDSLPVQSQLLEGDAGRMIAAAGGDLDLMIIGSRGYGPLKRTFLGSTSSRVIRQSPAPVLVLPRAAGSDPLGLGGDERDAESESELALI
jgi:nucleotide-binding universal stress UspA family protein